MATAQPDPMSVEEWALLPEDEDRELVDGFLVEAEVATFAHGYLVSELTARLREYFRPRGGWVVGDGVRMAIGRQRGRVPDAAVFLERPRTTGLVDAIPEIVVEVLSDGPTNQRRDRLVKLDEYAARGIPQYWLVDPGARTLELFTLTVAAGGPRLYARAAAAAAGVLTVPEYEGLSIDLDDLFAGLDD